MSQILPTDNEENYDMKKNQNNNESHKNSKNSKSSKNNDFKKHEKNNITNTVSTEKVVCFNDNIQHVSYGDGVGGGCLVIGWFMHLIPFMSVHRELFLIYYVFAYYFGILYLSLFLDSIFNKCLISKEETQKNTSSKMQLYFKDLNFNHFGMYILYFILILFFISFMYIRPLNTGELTPVDFLDRMAIVMPSCWSGTCFNSPVGTPFRNLLDQVGDDDRLIFPYLVNMEAM